MPDPALMPAIKAALRANEIGNGDPYKLSFALLGSSGASFGIFQADTAANRNALSTLRSILVAATMPIGQINNILAVLGVPCPTDPLHPEDEAAVNAALASAQGRALVDAMDARTLAVIGADLDLANAAAAKSENSINGEAQLAVCLWCNMSGPPSLLLTWLGGAAVTETGATVAPPGNPVTLDDMQRYLSRSSFFAAHPRNWAHFAASVAAGVELLPAEGEV
jgi:hypothetical protein